MLETALNWRAVLAYLLLLLVVAVLGLRSAILRLWSAVLRLLLRRVALRRIAGLVVLRRG